MADSGNFVHLHNHTHYSLLDGASKIPDLAKRAAELGMPAVGITDHGNMHGAYEMFTNCVANDVKPIIGIEAYVTPETARGDQSRVSWDTDWDPNLDPKHRRRNPDDVSGAGLITHLTLWAENDEGLVSLLKSSSRANLEGRVQRYPRMDKELLSTYSKGVICGSGCPSGIVQTRLALGQFDEALRAAGELQDIFGKDNFFIEIMDHNLHIERRNIKGLLEIAKKLNAPLLATNDSHYVRAEDAEAQDAMLCINSGSHLDDPDRFKFDGSGYYLKPADEMRELFKDFPGACDNTLEIAERCNVIFDDHEDGSFMPQFDCPEGWDETSLFLKKVEQGLEKRYDGNVPAEVAQQADYECGVICQMQFPGYFLVVADYIQWAKDHGIMVGPGRGSAAGSMVAYAMGITELDPLKHGLIFERFLNPERVSLPDIDVDFDPDGRGRVIEYCGEKYGKDKVAQCVIYGVIKTKQALKDSARIMGYDFSMGERVTKALPPSKNGKDASLKEIFNPDSKRYAEAREFRELYDSDPDAHKIIDKAKTIEGLIRQTGVHACATIMGSEPITDTSPLLERTDGTVTTTFEYHTCETLGLVKMDFLGLSNLTVIQDTLKNIVANGKPAIDYTKIPLDDAETYHLLARGDTLGVFQLDSDGMRALLKSLKPDNFNDISALIALYRPGPMDMDSHNNYAKRKNGLQKIEPIHPELEEPLKQVLDETYGLIVYQEQVQSAARILAGYSLGKADVLRRAMGKKKPEVLAKEKIPFFAGMKEHGYSEEAAQAVWDVLVPFSGYAFNKAHSAAYGLISYWTAYLKTHYPVEFMAALLQGAANNKDKTALYLGEARRMGIKVLPPDVNESVLKYSAVGDVVRFGLGAIRNVGEKAVEEIIAERESSRGRYVNFADFIKRVPLVALNRRLVESLIKAGAFDSIDPNRRALFTIHESAIEQMVPLKRKEAEGQFDLFAGLGDDEEDSGSALGDAGIVVPDVEEWDKKTKLNFEREMLGLYVSDHPLSGMASVLAGLRDMSIAQLVERAKDLPDREQVTIAGLITNIERRVSKKGNPWALVTVEDLDSSIQCMFFGKAYEGAAAEMALDTVVRIRGTVDLRDETVSLRATEMEVPTLEAEDERPLIIMLPQTAMDRVHVQSLGNILHQHPGYCEVRLAIMDAKGAVTMLTLGDGFRVKRDASLFGEIKATFGPASLPVA